MLSRWLGVHVSELLVLAVSTSVREAVHGGGRPRICMRRDGMPPPLVAALALELEGLDVLCFNFRRGCVYIFTCFH